METYDEFMKRHEEKQKKIDSEVAVLKIHYTIAELEQRFFKDFGCINFKTEDEQHELELACSFHEWHKQTFPEKHQMTETEPYRCYHKSACKCGFCTACDSSD